jgi:hypothetical protein
MNNTTSDLSAKLLANENVTVVRAPTSTASFDIKSRTLTLPQWKDMTPEIESMLVGHEVGHALFTDNTYLEPLEINRKLKTYMNVLEDVRIEKKLKRIYPGIRKTMTEGYRQLNERDFFGVKSVKDMNTLLLIDKINLYFKAGFSCGVSFSPAEKQFVNRAEATETIEEIIALANEIREYSKEKAKEAKEKQQQEYAEEDKEEDEEEDEEGFDGDFYDPEVTMEDEEDDLDLDEEKEERTSKKTIGRAPKVEDEVEQDLDAKTVDSFEQKLADLADTSTTYSYYELQDQYLVDPIVGYKTILSETVETDDHVNRKQVEEFKQETVRVVNYLVKEFEMRKSAQMYKRAQTSKIGSLDMKKIWSYKLKDDVFKRITTIAEGKNHGMIFLLDWSGSMQEVINDTIKQVINLALFCQRAQIPYQVFAFSSQYDTGADQYARHTSNAGARNSEKNLIMNNSGGFALLELFSSRMSNTDFNTMMRRVLTHEFFYQKHGQYSLGGTPLNESIMYMYKYIGKFIKMNSIEKMTLITLTDGQGGHLIRNCGSGIRDNEYAMDVKTGQYRRVKTKHFIRDSSTKKNYEITQHASTHTPALLSMVKDHYGINVVGFYICSNTQYALREAITNNLPTFNGQMTETIVSIRADFRENGYSSLMNTGRNELFIVPLSSTKINNSEMTADSDMTAAAISRKFSKFMGGKKTSRVLLNKFIGYVA